MSDTQQQESQTILAFEGFTGLNTNASRPGIKDSELSLCDGWMPLGDSNLRTMPGIGPGIFPAPTSTTIKFYDFGNIATKPLMIAFPSDGSIWQVNTITLTATQMAPPGTITNVARNAVGITQWGNAAIIVVAQQENGYFVLDGTLFYQAGTLAPFDASQLTSGGAAYTSIPTYTVFGGSGSGVQLTPVLTSGSITDLIITNPGIGYLPGDIVQVGFQGGGSDTTPILEAVIATGVIQFLTLVSGGSGFQNGTFPLTFSGGGGTGAAGTFTASGGTVTSVNLTAGGANYTGAPTISFPVPGTGGSITATEAGFPVATYTLPNAGTTYNTASGVATTPGGAQPGLGSGMTLNITASSGPITVSSLATGGNNYAPGDTGTVTGGTGDATYHVTTVGATGTVTGLTIVSGGIGYVPGTYFITFTGGSGGTGAIATYTVNLSGVIASTNLVAGGAGYRSAPTCVLNAGTGAVAVAAITPGAVTSVNIIQGGTNLNGTPLLTVVGGGGTGAQLVATITGGAISSVAVTAGGAGYTSIPAIEIQAGLNNAASAILQVMPFGISGATAETYQSRVWVANPFSTNPQGAGGTVNFTAPGSYTDFSTADGGGSFTSNDSFLRVAYVGLIQTNGFLYLIGDSSINYIGGVTTSGNPPQTSFTNQNADPETGSPYPGTMDVVGSNIVFANAFGAHVSYGGRVAKISEPLDGFYSSVPNQFGDFPLSAAKAIVYGKRIWALLIPVIDQFTGQQVNKLCMWNPDKKSWWTSQQDVPLTYVNTQEIASVETAYGTNGANVFPLFQVPSTAFAKVAQSKLWAKPGGYMNAKSSSRVWLVAQYFSDLSPAITFDTDNDAEQSASVVLTPTLASPPVGYFVSPPTASSQTGTLLGMTLTTNAADVALISAAVDAEVVGFRG